jgi:hypothetical protein
MKNKSAIITASASGFAMNHPYADGGLSRNV